MILVSERSALKACRITLERLGEVRRRHNHNFEIQDLLIDLADGASAIRDLRDFLAFSAADSPERLLKGAKKAERAYVCTHDPITKSSYIKRVHSFSDYSERTKLPNKINQIASVAKGFCEEPNASYHVISFFRPIDLLEKFRPGYVPCVVSADFKYRAGALHAKYFFRSCDAYNLLPFDLSYCTAIAEQLLNAIRKEGFKKPLELGNISFWFSRIYISRFDVASRKRMIAAINDFKKVEITERPIKTERRAAKFGLIASSRDKVPRASN